MEIIKETLNKDIFKESSIFERYFEGLSYAVFDIETTGLSPKFNKVILTGIIKNVPGQDPELYQFFAQHPAEEEEVIRKTVEVLNEVDFVITYNGKSFDMPFMAERSRKYDVQLGQIYNLDFYVLVKNYSGLSGVLPNMKQKTVEKFMGLTDQREDEIDGGESVKMYNTYVQTRDEQLKEFILLHNHDDIIQLQKIIPILSKLDYHRAFYNLGLPCKRKSGALSIFENIKCAKGGIYLQGTTGDSLDYICFPTVDKNMRAQISSTDGRFQIEINTEIESGYWILDATAYLSEDQMEKLSKLPNYKSGYLVVSDGKTINTMEVVEFAKSFIENDFSIL